MDDPSYELKLKQSLTVKPGGFFIHAIPRKDRGPMLHTGSGSSLLRARKGTYEHKSSIPRSPSLVPHADPKQPMYVVYGSNTGTSETFAQRIAGDAAQHGKNREIWFLLPLLIIS